MVLNINITRKIANVEFDEKLDDLISYTNPEEYQIVKEEINYLNDNHLSRFNSDKFDKYFPYIRKNAKLLIYFGCADQFIERCPDLNITLSKLENNSKEICQEVNEVFEDDLFQIHNGDEILVLKSCIFELLESENSNIPPEIRKGRNKIIKYLLKTFSSYVFHVFPESVERDVALDVSEDIDYFWMRAYEDCD